MEPILSDGEAPLVPARMLNELAYCPRLFGLEWIDGLWRDNHHTVEGRVEHRRVDERRAPRDGIAGIPGLDGEIRSMSLSSPKIGVTARLDRVLIEGDSAIPIEHKKGRAPRAPVPIGGGLDSDWPDPDEDSGQGEEGEPAGSEKDHTAPGAGIRVWWPDQVQVAVQCLLLEESGFRVERGYVYYAREKRRVEVPWTDELRRAVQQLISVAQRMAKTRELPPPLVDSPRCHGCSLQPICLPDEVNALRSGQLAKNEGEELRRILAPTDDELSLYVMTPGARVRKSGESLCVEHEGVVLQSVPIRRVRQVALFGNVQISTQTITALMDAQIPVVYLARSGRFVGMTSGLPLHNVLLRKAQFEKLSRVEVALAVAQGIVAAKLANQRVLLMRNGEDVPDSALQELRRCIESAERASTLDEVRGHEGAGAAVYFRHFGAMLRRSPEGLPAFDFEGRNRRPARDPINAMLSFGYALLAKEVTSTCLAVGLDPLLGALHSPAFRRPALALDLMEEWRPLIVDSCVLTLVNNGMVRREDFYLVGGACEMRDKARRAFLEMYEKRLQTEVTHPLFGYRISYRRAIEVQVRLFARVLAGELERYIGFRTR